MSLRLSFGRRNAAAALLIALSATACLSGTEPSVQNDPSDPATETYASSLGVDMTAMTKYSSDLYYQDLVVGTGAPVAPGKQLTVDYTGWLPNGTKFDTNDGNGPYGPFTLQAAQVIAGWDLGIVGMHVGGKRRLLVGSNLGYGPNILRDSFGNVVIPANSTLVFDVTVLSTQ